MNAFIQLFPPLGYYLGPTFILTPDFGFANPSTVTRDELLDGIYIELTDPNATNVQIQSLDGECTSSIMLYIRNETTTTTTTFIIP